MVCCWEQKLTVNDEIGCTGMQCTSWILVRPPIEIIHWIQRCSLEHPLSRFFRRLRAEPSSVVQCNTAVVVHCKERSIFQHDQTVLWWSYLYESCYASRKYSDRMIASYHMSTTHITPLGYGATTLYTHALFDCTNSRERRCHGGPDSPLHWIWFHKFCLIKKRIQNKWTRATYPNVLVLNRHIDI